MTISPARGNRWALLGTVVSLALVGLATLAPEGGVKQTDVALFCLRCGQLGGPDLLLNIVLFVPVGLALAALGMRPRRVLVTGLLLSLGIESLQLVIPGRYSTLRDVLCNGVGAWLGAIILLHLPRWLLPSRASGLRLAAASLAAVGTVVATGWMMDYFPSATPYYGHWSPDQPHLEHWTGQVERAELDGIPVADWRLRDEMRIRDELADGFVLEIAGTGGARTSEQGGILTISDGAKHEVLLVGPNGTDLVVRVRRRAAGLRLAATEARFPQLMLGAEDGVPLAIRIDASKARTCATVNGKQACVGRPLAGSAWVLLFTDRGTSASARILLSALTFVALAFPVGLLLPSAAPAHRWTAVLALIAGTAIGSTRSGLDAPLLVEWLGLAGGLVAGVVLNRLVGKAAAGSPPVAPA